MPEESLLRGQQHGVLTLTLSRPDVFNALDTALLRSLAEGMRDAEREPGRAGTGRGNAAFRCLAAQTLQSAHPGMRRVDKPIIAAVNGVAAGAGMSLALACDLRLASPQASFTEVFAKIALVPDSGSLYFLPRLVGLGKAMEVRLLADRVDAKEALRLGIVNRVVVEDLLQVAEEWAARLAAGPSKAAALIKRGLRRSNESTLEQMLEYEADLQEIVGRTHDFREGVMAFAEKRQPNFSGD